MRAAFLAPLLICLGGCSGSLCSNQTVKSVRSPDGEHVATLFMRECGATTDFTTQVSVDPWFWQAIGNAFVADAYSGGLRGEWGGPWADATWTGPNHLLIRYDGKARVFDKNIRIGDVGVTYEPVTH